MSNRTINCSVRGNGPPLLFIHGIPTGGRLWDFVVERLESACTCIVVDLPGLGASPPLPDGSLDPGRFAQELELLRRDLAFPSWSVVGHDAGATVAVHFAAAYPEQTQKLVLLSPPLFPEFQPPWFFRLLRFPFLGELLAPAVVLLIWHGGMRRIMERPDPTLSEILESFHEPFRGWRGAGRLVRLVRWGNPSEVLGKTARLLSRISAPTLILHGRRDGVIPESFAQRAAKMIARAQVRFFDTGHFLPLNIPEVLSDQVASFLNSNPEPVGNRLMAVPESS